MIKSKLEHGTRPGTTAVTGLKSNEMIHITCTIFGSAVCSNNDIELVVKFFSGGGGNFRIRSRSLGNLRAATSRASSGISLFSFLLPTFQTVSPPYHQSYGTHNSLCQIAVSICLHAGNVSCDTTPDSLRPKFKSTRLPLDLGQVLVLLIARRERN